MGRRARHEVPAIVWGLNVNGLAVARCLGRHGVPVVGVTDDPSAPEARSRYLRAVWRVDSLEADLPRVLHDRLAGAGGERPVLLPVVEGAVARLAEHRDELAAFCRFAMPDAGLVRQLLDKHGFDSLARRSGLPVPRTETVADRPSLEAVAGELRYPVILKPVVKLEGVPVAGGGKAWILGDPEELLAAYDRLAAVEPRAVVQELVEGGDDEVWFCLHYVDAAGRVRATFTGRKIRQWRPLCGGTASCEPAEAPQAAELSRRFFESVGFFGICSMEFKRDPRDGRFWAIEPTVCRTDWQSAIADANGVPIPYLAYLDLLERPLPRLRPKRRRRWVNLGHDRLAAHHYRMRGELGRLRWLWSIRPPVRGAYWAVDDLGPFVAVARRALRERLARRRARGSGGPDGDADRDASRESAPSR